MERELEKALTNYFSYVEKLNCKWHEIIQAISRPIDSLKNQSEQLCQVSSPEVENAEICHINNARERLIFKINMGIEDEIAAIADALRNLNNLYQELKNKLKHLDMLRSKKIENDLIMCDLINGSSYRPRLNLLLEWAIQIHKYYLQCYHNMNNSYKALDKKDKDTIEKMASSFAISTIERDNVMNILSFTQYLLKKNT